MIFSSCRYGLAIPFEPCSMVGGQFEWIICLVKQALYKTIGRSLLTFSELEDVLLDV